MAYGHEHKAISYKVKEAKVHSINEYDFANHFLNTFNHEPLKPESEIFEYYKNTKPTLPKIESFEFIEELEIEALYEKKKEEEFYLITAKQKNSLNSQFKIDNCAYIHPSTKFNDGDEVLLKTAYGKINFTLQHNKDVKKDCILIYAGAKKGNYLTPNISDEEAFSAMYQEVLVSIELS